MFSRAAVRATTQVAGRRGFQSTRVQMSSPFHYPEGPYTNIPFNPKAKTFPLLFWGYAATGFGLPFAIASAYCGPLAMACCRWLTMPVYSMANVQAQGLSCDSAVFDTDGHMCHIVVEHEMDRQGEAGGWIDLTIDIFNKRIPSSLDISGYAHVSLVSFVGDAKCAWGKDAQNALPGLRDRLFAGRAVTRIRTRGRDAHRPL